MSHFEASERIKALQGELELILRFEKLVESDPCNGYEVVIGRLARRLRLAEIVRELDRLHASRSCGQEGSETLPS